MTHLTELHPQEKLSLSGSFHPSNGKYKARFVRAGAVKSADGQPTNLIIEAQALQKAVSRFNKLAVFIDHAGFFENSSLTRLAGTTTNASYNPQDPSIEGEISLNQTPSGELARELITEILTEPDNAPDIGLSIVFYAKFAPRDDLSQPRRIIDIRHVESVDLVFQPAADGRILQALSRAALSTTGQAIHFSNTLNPKGKTAMPEPEERTQPDPKELHDLWLAQDHAVASQQVISRTIQASGLPEPARKRLQAQTYSTPGELNQAIEAERDYLAALSENQVIQIGGQPPRSPHISGMRNSLDQIEIALEAMISGTRPRDHIAPLNGLRDLYHQLSGDYEMSGVFHSDRVQLANVNSSTMANMVANALNKVVMAEFQSYPQWWLPIVESVDFDSLQSIRWMTLGGVGELPTVAEGAAYTELTWDDKYETSSFVKKGGYLGITMEAIDKDETGRLRNAPRALAQAAWLTLSKAISAIFSANGGVGPTLTDSTALFDASRGNLGTTALSVSSFAAARAAMRKFTELNSGERMGAICAPKFLLVPPDLEITALQTLASEYDYSYALSNGQAAPTNVLGEGSDIQARMNFARQRVIVVDLWTDSNDWAAVADPRMVPTIGLGFRYGRAPEIFSVASPTAGLMFTNDTMPVKVRYVYAAGPIDWRGLYKANVA